MKKLQNTIVTLERPPSELLRFLTPRIVLALALLACTFIYWNGLKGGFLFDDFPNIVDNTSVHVTSLNSKDWWRAGMGSPSRELRRPLAMISFAINEYFNGNDPFPMKLTNLVIHLVNGVLLYLMMTTLLGLHQNNSSASRSPNQVRWVSVAIATIWLLAPINLSTTLYVVQRMESLAQTFILVGLWQYLKGREQQVNNQGGMLRLTAALIASTGAGLLAKESAVLIPLYAFLVEVTVLRFEAASRTKRRNLFMLFALILIVPGLLGTVWVLPSLFQPEAYASRPFTLVQRLLSEPRILLHYVDWTLLPTATKLGFYHDDIPTSISLFDPMTTIGAIFVLVTLALVACWQIRSRPFFSLGIFWFFSAHLLTATFIPLELVFEHRNYFSSIGLMLSISTFFLDLPSIATWAKVAGTSIVIFLFGFITFERSQDWSHPIRFAYAEVEHHPGSPRANYVLGQTLIIASAYNPESPLIIPATTALQKAASLPGSSVLPEAGLIILSGHINRPIDPRWWEYLTAKLQAQPASEDDISALSSISKCQIKRICPAQSQELLTAFLAALSHFPAKPRLLGDYSDFVETQLDDYPLAESLLKQAIELAPSEVDYKLSLARVMFEQNKFTEGRNVLERLRNDDLSPSQEAISRELSNTW